MTPRQARTARWIAVAVLGIAAIAVIAAGWSAWH